MQAMFKVPDDSIAHFQSPALERGIECNIKRNHLALVDIVPDLPTDAPLRMKDADAFFDNEVLPSKIFVEISLPLVRLAEVVWWRGHNQANATIGNIPK
jgi:hypothetical protein